MKFVYLLEDDPKFQKEICEAISFVDPKIQVRIFSKLENFAQWLKLMMATGPSAIARGGLVPQFVPQEFSSDSDPPQLILVISKVEFLGAEHLELLRKTRQLFIDRKICTAEDPTAFVLTAFDNPQFHLKDLENRILNNVILKPFDRLILAQHLTFAISGRHPPTHLAITNQKTSTVIEMLKDIELESLSDIGFVSKSYREIQVGSVSKYYGKSFLSDRHKSLFAVCRDCKPHPEDPKHFRCSFTYFAADQTQISNLRRKTRILQSALEEFKLPVQPMDSPDFQVVLIDDEEKGPQGLEGLLEKSFKGVHTIVFPSFASFVADLDPDTAFEERDVNLKALGGAAIVQLDFDAVGVSVLGMDSDKKDLKGLFGLPFSDPKMQGNWFLKNLIPEHKEKWRSYVQTGKLSGNDILSLSMNEIPFWVRVTKIEKTAAKITVTFAETSREEQIDWMKRNSKLKRPLHLIIGHHRLFSENAQERWSQIKQSAKDRFGRSPEVFMTSKSDFSDEQERLLGTVIADIFFKPVDRVYFLQKMKFHFPFLAEKNEKIEIKSIKHEEIIKSASPINVTEISEAGFVMQYYRPIAVGSFREIILWQPYEVGAPELLATCNFVEESQTQKGVWNCHFVFFGMGDHFLKHIRIWIRNNYVHSKEGQAA